ncbi:MAG: phage major capsid protein [Arcanobacterium sp.]|nr:phage major capsid protein [Arcanobacterium sp.]
MPLGTNATTLSTLETLLPKPVASQIMADAYGQSLIGRLAGTTPMPITGTSIAFATGEPVAGIVGEGELKPVIKQTHAVKSATPIKAAALMYWSKEARQANPVAYLNLLKNTARDAITRAIDMAVIHGKNALTNSPISGVEYITQSMNTVELGTTDAAHGGITGDILAAYDLVVQDGGDVTGFAADPLTRTKLMRATYTDGSPIYTSGNAGRGGVNLADPMGDLLGLPVAYGKAVSGKIGTVADTNVRLIGGKFKDAIKFGYVENITFRQTDTGIVQDGDVQVNLFQQNMEAFIVEAQFGWIIKNVDEFALLKEPAGE